MFEYLSNYRLWGTFSFRSFILLQISDGSAAARRSSRRRLRGCDGDGCGGVPATSWRLPTATVCGGPRGDVFAAADSDDCFLLAATATRLRTATAAFLLAATATPLLLRRRRLDDGTLFWKRKREDGAALVLE
nr:hypothetical protein Iba_chr01aCG17480 [Ipomoea batatas]GMD39365.1 hypothetical protein Iba_chr09fCG12880 [Ipomoea batatas]GME03641.1 hypothetical protein Iba_scaffold1011.2CG0010 [Ipomoea batatas]